MFLAVVVLESRVFSYLEFLLFGHYSDFEWFFCLEHGVNVCSLLTLPGIVKTAVHDHLSLVSSGIEVEGDVVIASHKVDGKPAKGGNSN
jgi:hypothetical protein